jgi:hypothetical protein
VQTVAEEVSMTTTQMTKENAEQKGRGEGKAPQMESKGSQVEGKGSQIEGKAAQIEGKAAQIEGKATQMIEKKAAAIPSGTFLVLAGGAIAGSLALKVLGRHSTANFVGQWAPTFLMLGLYSKMVQVLGSEGPSATQERSGGMQERSGSMYERSGVSGAASSGAANERPGASTERPGASIGASTERPGIAH